MFLSFFFSFSLVLAQALSPFCFTSHSFAHFRIDLFINWFLFFSSNSSNTYSSAASFLSWKWMEKPTEKRNQVHTEKNQLTNRSHVVYVFCFQVFHSFILALLLFDLPHTHTLHACRGVSFFSFPHRVYIHVTLHTYGICGVNVRNKVSHIEFQNKIFLFRHQGWKK